MQDYEKIIEAKEKAGIGTELSPDFVKWSVGGEPIIGKYITSALIKGRKEGQEYRQYVFDTSKGRVKFHLGSVTDAEIAGDLITGHIYKITFRGKLALEGGRSVNQFAVKDYGPATEDQADEIPF